MQPRRLRAASTARSHGARPPQPQHAAGPIRSPRSLLLEARDSRSGLSARSGVMAAPVLFLKEEIDPLCEVVIVQCVTSSSANVAWHCIVVRLASRSFAGCCGSSSRRVNGTNG